MKANITFLLIILFSLQTKAQYAADTSMLRKEMQKLAWMEGEWDGTATMRMGPGKPMVVSQKETIEYKLDGLMLMIEGLGKYKDPNSGKEKVGHHAIAVVTYDPQKGHYRFQSYLNTGVKGDTFLKIVGENQYEWGFEGRVKYLITYDPNDQTWNETGEYSQDGGTTWNKFIEMSLKKVERGG